MNYKSQKKQRKFGLIGKNISYSFSKKYFSEKFINNHFHNCEYENYDIENIKEFTEIIDKTKGLVGLNVTIPYKESILPFLDKISNNAKKIGAVNCISISKNNKLKGYNTDFYGFKKSIQPMLKKKHKKALILGTGGASKAVAFALKKLNIEFDFVSRNPTEYEIGYKEINAAIFNEYQIIINTTPLGTFPNISESPKLDYSLFTANHIAFDLVYNPEESTFLKKAKKSGAVTKNGLEMLINQAEKAWLIWNK
ncbi:shikimate dehydrogenase family protein [Flavobacterium sp.]|jgi:shikimate dehydrogenase|uniref:shikimate dehydrogenase family protein n=1 Tax=Flavobacterium sp. TaxID=239 RepID=UPI0037C07126